MLRVKGQGLRTGPWTRARDDHYPKQELQIIKEDEKKNKSRQCVCVFEEQEAGPDNKQFARDDSMAQECSAALFHVGDVTAVRASFSTRWHGDIYRIEPLVKTKQKKTRRPGGGRGDAVTN